MENKLKRLFDYQRFAKNENLQKTIEDSLNRNPEVIELALNDASLAMAVGGRKHDPSKEKEEEEKRFLDKDRENRI